MSLIKSKVCTSFLAISLMVAGLSSAYAEDSVNEASLGQIGDDGVSIMAEAEYPGAGTYYKPVSTERIEDIAFEMDVENIGAISTTVVRSVAVRKFAQLSIGGETELGIMGQKVKATANVSAGVDQTVTTSVTWNVPPKSKYTIRAGSYVIKTNGYLETANSGGVVVSQKYTTGKWTTKDLVDGKPAK
ncbi:hypothetical protein [Paenibacillus sp. 1781tsa1]|uniref:hypothetical protein n=1 Tax=Paenibacillus sp. 1781tsa1 TaxID=2953810 RepID=UPI00209DD942|nr:hypothetical protein [Paenibacillus sp. 1781tsa1]MCP1187080.1 hypothetical protein [Paenibacillus sp. 1781tsa1]